MCHLRPVRGHQKSLTPEMNAEASEELKRLQEQNDRLRAVITQMSRQMESLSHPPNPNSAKPQADPSEPSDLISIPPFADAQIPNQQPASSQDSIPKLNPTDEHPRHNGLKEKVKVAETQSPHSGSIQQQVSVNSLPLQQPASSPKLCRQFENIQSSSRKDTSLLHARLKQAAGWIVRLSKDKQQLIEMGNRLRAQITSGDSQVIPERSPSPETPGLHCDRLSQQEQQENHLTTQELQSVLKKMTVPAAEQLLSQRDQQALLTTDSLIVCRQHHSEISNQKGRNCPSHFPGLSSDESLQELWDLMDGGLGSSMLSDGELELTRGLGVQTAEQGWASMSRQPFDFQQERNLHKSPFNTRRPATNRGSKIRNYNIKD